MKFFKGKLSFDKEREKQEEIIKYSLKLLSTGISAEATREAVLSSQLYKEWKALHKISSAGFRTKHFYEDLKEQMNIEKDCKWIDNLAKEYFIDIKQGKNIEIVKEFKSNKIDTIPMQWFRDLNYEITEKELAYEIAHISSKLQLSKPISVLEFLSLVKSLRDENTIIYELGVTKDKVGPYVNNFDEKYKKNNFFNLSENFK